MNKSLTVVICVITVVLVISMLFANTFVYGESIAFNSGDVDKNGIVDTGDLAQLKLILAGIINDDTTESEPKILDSGKCGENLGWALYSDGLLKISGTGRSYDYCKGLFGDDVTRTTIEEYQAALEGKTDLDSIAKYERGFQEGKVYDDANGQYIAPWYKYRKETLISADGTKILNPDGSMYMSVADYEKDNPNGWTYNRIEIDPGVTYIGNWFFYRVAGPTELVLPNTVTEIGQWSIRFSPTLKYVYLPDSVVSIEKRGCSRLEVVEEIRTGIGLKSLGDWAFAQNATLKSIVVNGKIETMGTYTFGYNKKLEYVKFTNLESLNGVHFVDCNNLKEVTFSENLKSISTVALVNRPIETVKIPKNVIQIGTSAFYGCTKLETVYIDSAVIAQELKYSSSCGHLVAYAKNVYVKSDITEIGNYLLNKYTKCAEENGYVLYSLIQTEE